MMALMLALVRLLRAVRRGLQDDDFRALLSVAALLLLTGTVFYRFQEGWSVLDAAFFSLITLTTVGYGDLVPTTALSKIFTMVYVVLGIGVLIGFLNKLAWAMAVELRERKAAPPRP